MHYMTNKYTENVLLCFTKNKTIIEDKKCLKEVKERGWDISNRNMVRDEEGELTYIDARDSSVIDYAIGNVETREKFD